MKAIGPYVVNREVSPARGAGAGAFATAPSARSLASRTLWVTDRLTGMPALLHELPAPMPAPELPVSGALLPFSDLVIEGLQTFLVTELPLHAAPARDPLLAAQGALVALDALHSHGLAHGGLDSGQLWSVDGRVVLVGGGLHRLDQIFSVGRDLKDLAHTLVSLGGLPAALSPLLDPGPSLNAQQARQLLGNAAEGGAASAAQQDYLSAEIREKGSSADLTRRSMSLLDNSAPLPQAGPYLWSTNWKSFEDDVPANGGIMPAFPNQAAQADIAPGAGEALQLDISEWALPEFLESLAPSAVAPTPDAALTAAPAALHWAKPNRLSESPVATPEQAAAQNPSSQNTVLHEGLGSAPSGQGISAEDSSQAAQEALPKRVGTDLMVPVVSRGAKAAATRALARLRTDTRRAQSLAEARRDHLPSQWQAAAEGKLPAPTQPPAETPQERRRRAYAATAEQASFDAQSAAERRAKRLAQLSSETAPADRAAEAPAAASKRTLKPIKVTWTANQTWQVVHGDQAVRSSLASTVLGKVGSSAALKWWPLLAALMLIALLSAWVVNSRHKTVAATCCNVEFILRGQAATGKTARLSLESAPPAARLSAGQALGTAPGQIHLPVAGNYQVRVITDGFTPATVAVTVPSSQPVQINLGQ